MKKYFYDVFYQKADKNGCGAVFFIGYFSCIEKARLAIDSVKDKPGFRDSNGNFEINKFAVQFKSDIKEKSGLLLFEVSHEYLDSEGFDNCTIFGVYETEEEAQKIKTEKEKILPYCEIPEGFMISECKVDLVGWTEGFVPWT